MGPIAFIIESGLINIFMQNHVLISLGHCMALGVIVPVPYYLQEWLQIPNWNKSSADAGRALRKIYCSIEVSARDRAFLIDVMSGRKDWLTSDAGSIHGCRELTDLLMQKLNKVRGVNCIFRVCS